MTEAYFDQPVADAPETTTFELVRPPLFPASRRDDKARTRPPRRSRHPGRRLLGDSYAAGGGEFPHHRRPVGHFPELVRALALVKQAAARANRRLGHLPVEKAEAIDRACGLIVSDKRFLDQFVVDAVQGGAGTSTNMNANEVIANVALELMGRLARRLWRAAPDRRRQHGPIHQRRLPVRLAPRRDLRHGVRSRTCCRISPSPSKPRRWSSATC